MIPAKSYRVVSTAQWDSLKEGSCIDTQVDVINSYIDFCVQNVIPTKTVTLYPNNKPWLNKELKDIINKKKKGFSSRSVSERKSMQAEVTCAIRHAKSKYRDKIEAMFKSNNTKQAWNGLRVVTGYKKKTVMPDPDNINEYVNELNEFYARFDTYDFSNECAHIIDQLKQSNDSKIVITESDVIHSLNRVTAGKACGPDNITGRVVKTCKQQFVHIFVYLFQMSLDEHVGPKIWKTSELIPVPKINLPKVKNDLRPIALTSIIMKCLEFIVKDKFSPEYKLYRDPYQFAYSANRCVDDACLTLLHDMYSFLDRTGNRFVKIVFIDFSSAFNTIQTHLLLTKLINMNINSNIILWIHSFLCDRLQYVKMCDVKSNVIVTNTGAPQGCVLSPILFSIYTADIRSTLPSCKIYKYADDTAIVGLCDDNDLMYRDICSDFVRYCDNNYLNLNVRKTKELIVDFRSRPNIVHIPLVIKDEIVECVDEYKYLGTIIDSKLNFHNNVSTIYKKVNKRLYFLRTLYHIKIDTKIMSLFYTSVIESVLCFCINVWSGNCTLKDRNMLSKLIRRVQRMGVLTVSLNDLCNLHCIKTCKKIIRDKTHPLNNHYEKMPSGRRYRSLSCKGKRYHSSFVPTSLRILNV